jgi:CRP-like cAMP-binding protein
LKHELYAFASKLGEGSSFGELALINKNAKRAATIRCTQDCHLAILTEADY